MAIWFNFCQCGVEGLNPWHPRKHRETNHMVCDVCMYMCCHEQVTYTRVYIYHIYTHTYKGRFVNLDKLSLAHDNYKDTHNV